MLSYNKYLSGTYKSRLNFMLHYIAIKQNCEFYTACSCNTLALVSEVPAIAVIPHRQAPTLHYM